MEKRIEKGERTLDLVVGQGGAGTRQSGPGMQGQGACDALGADVVGERVASARERHGGGWIRRLVQRFQAIEAGDDGAGGDHGFGLQKRHVRIVALGAGDVQGDHAVALGQLVPAFAAECARPHGIAAGQRHRGARRSGRDAYPGVEERLGTSRVGVSRLRAAREQAIKRHGRRSGRRSEGRAASSAGRQLGHQPQRGGQFLELEVRSQMGNRRVRPGLSFHVAHRDLRLAQRETGPSWRGMPCRRPSRTARSSDS